MWTKRYLKLTGEPPVHKELQKHYDKAMERMRVLGHEGECLSNIIAYQEQEIDEYRAKIEKLKEEIYRYKNDSVPALEYCNGLIAEGIEIGEGLPRVGKNDKLILRARRSFTKESMAEFQNEIEERTGMEVALLDSWVDLIGVVESGT